MGSHLLQQDFESPVERAEEAVGGECWQLVAEQTSPSTSQLSQAGAFSPPTAQASKKKKKNQAGRSILWAIGASKTIIHCSRPPPSCTRVLLSHCTHPTGTAPALPGRRDSVPQLPQHLPHPFLEGTHSLSTAERLPSITLTKSW